MKVRNIMTQPPPVCRAETSLRAAGCQMAETASGTLTILDGHGRVAGILTDRDLALAVGNSEHDANQIPVEEAMTRNVYTCQPDETIAVILERMADTKVRRLPVVAADGSLVGIVSIDDIILWGMPHRGISRNALVKALRSICSAHEPLLETERLEVS
jgi:CBS domain-containing protein